MRPTTLWARGRDFLRSYWTPAGKQALANLIGLVACTGVSQLCAFGVLLLLTHGLPQEGFGAVIFALNLQSYLVAVGTFGLTTIVVRDLAQHPDKRAETITAYLTIVTAASVLVGVITAVVAAVVPISADERVMLWCIAAGNVAACLNLNPLFDSAHKQALAAALAVPGDVLLIAVVGGAYSLGAVSVPLAGFALLGRVVMTALLHALVHRMKWPFSWAAGWDRVRRLMRAGWPMLVSGLVYAIPMGGSVILVRLLSGETETAIYGLAFQLITAELMVVGLVLRVLQPHVSGGYGLTARFLRKLGVVVCCGLVALLAGVFGVGWVLFSHILPDEYRPAFAVLAVLQVMIVFYVLAAVTNLYLLRFRREGWVQLSHLIAVAVYLLLVAAGCWRYALGYAVSSAASTAVLFAVALLGLRAGEKPSPSGAKEVIA